MLRASDESQEGATVAIASEARDDETIRSGIEQWLRTHDAELVGATVAPLTRPTAGLSSETYFVNAQPATGVGREWVVRMAPAGAGLFPQYDLRGQVEVQNALAGAGIPVAAPARYEADHAWLGAPFMVMPRVAGRVVSTRPAYVRAGWLFDAPAEFQARVLQGFLETLARVHRAGRRSGEDSPSIVWEPSGEPGDYLDWAAAGGEIPDYLTRARDWCAANAPRRSHPPVALWGDVQLANCVFHETGDVAALLDFELAGTGPAEMDLGWFLALHEMTAASNGGDLPGFGDRVAMIATYERALDRSVESIRWYEVLALLRSGAIMVRIARLLAAQGVDDSWLRRDNPTEAALARVLALQE